MKKHESETRKPLPKTERGVVLDGALCAQYKRCGKPTCRCARGDLHGPYFYRFRWRAGRAVKSYVPLSQVEAVRSACVRYRAERAEVRAGDAHLRRMLAAIKARVKGLGL